MLCPNSWPVRYKDSCYAAFSMAQGISWTEAESRCNRDYGHLVSIMDEDEMHVVHFIILTLLGTKEMKTYIGNYLLKLLK